MKKKLSAVLAAIIVLTSLTACGGNGTEVDSAGSDGAAATTTTAVTTAPLTEEELSKVVAYVDKDGADPEHFNITYGDFNREYQFYLGNNGKDENNEEDKDACEQYRRSIIEFLTTERITLYLADQKGLGIDDLTEEELEEINSTVEETLEQWYISYESEAKAALGEEATEEQIREKEIELFNEFMDSCGLEHDIFYTWQKNSYVQQKLMESEFADIDITDGEITAFLDETVAEAKECYENDIATYETSNTYKAVYIPEGTKNIRQIMLSFGDDDLQAISNFRNSDDNETADALRDQLAEMKQGEVDKIMQRLADGEDFAAISKEYNGSDSEYEFTVVPNSSLCSKELLEIVDSLENEGDYSQPTVTDYGLLIIQYSSTPKVTEEDMENLRVSAEDYLLYEAKTERSSRLLEQWKTEFPYVIDYAALRLEDPNTVSSDGE